MMAAMERVGGTAMRAGFVLALVVALACVSFVVNAQTTPASSGGSTPSTGSTSASPSNDASADKQCPAETATAKYSKNEPEDQPYSEYHAVNGTAVKTVIQNLYGKPCNYSMSQQQVVKGKCVAANDCRCRDVMLMGGTFVSCSQTPGVSSGVSASVTTPQPTQTGPVYVSTDGSTELPGMMSNLPGLNPITPMDGSSDGSTVGDMSGKENTANAGGSQYSETTPANAPVTTSFGGSTQAINSYANSSDSGSAATPGDSSGSSAGGMSGVGDEAAYQNLNQQAQMYQQNPVTTGCAADSAFCQKTMAGVDNGTIRLSTNIEDRRFAAAPMVQNDQPLIQFPLSPTMNNGYLNSISFDTPNYTFLGPTAAAAPSNTTFSSVDQTNALASAIPQNISVSDYYYPQSEGPTPVSGALSGSYGVFPSGGGPSFFNVITSPLAFLGNWFAGLFK